MSSIKWTPEQLEAIDIRDTDTLVSAAAGSGKTAVLVERVIRRITDSENPVDIDKILVVTFTNAAARQMKEKVSKALVSAIEKEPENENLRKQLILLGSAEINTVHSFCMNVIRNNFQDTDLPYEFDIVNDTENVMLMEDALDETFCELYEDEEKCGDFERFIDCFSDKDDSNAAKLCLEAYDFLRSMPFYRDWLKEQASELDFDNPDDTVWGRYIKDYALKMLDCAENINRWLLEFFEENGKAFGVDVYRNSSIDDRNMIIQLKKVVNEGVFNAYDAFSSVGVGAIGRKNAGTDPECGEFIKKVRANVKEIIEDLRDNVFYLSPEEIIETSRRSREALSMLAEVILRFDSKFSEKKQKKGVVDFSDLEHKCVGILAELKDGEYIPTKAALELRSKYAEVMVDEYQDTNYLQEQIISMVSGEGKRFMVGDVKQSIYGFRNAKPQLFLEKYNTYAREAGFADRRLLLSRNFRSASHILDFVNFIFSNLMSKECGGLDYGDDEKLYFGEGYKKTDSTDIYLIDKADYDDELDSDEREALFCASKIKSMVESGYEIEDGGEVRSCRYSDFTVLIRNVNKYTDIYRSAFERYDVPIYIEKGKSYFDAPEIKLAVSLLRVIDNPRQDIELIAVLRSHIFGFDDDMLVNLRLEDERADIYTCLTKAVKKGFYGAERFFECLKRWRNVADNSSVRTLVELLFDECNMYTVFPEGAKKLRALADWAEKYGKTSYKGLFRFITFLQRQIEQNEDIGGNGLPSENSVTLMSIHKSKGLENGIVILANTGKSFNLENIGKKIFFDDYLGITTDFVDTENKIIYASFPKIASLRKNIQDCIAEDLRLLYVALTRAKFKLIITGTVNRLEAYAEKLKVRAVCKDKNGFSVYTALESKSYLEWILSALMSHPGCGVLHKIGFDIIGKKPVDFDVNIIVSPQLEEPFEQQAVQMPVAVPDENYADVSRVLEYEYPFSSACTVPSKLSVSEIKSKFYAEITDDGTVFYPRSIDSSVQITPAPSFLSESGKLSSAALGTAYHSILQYIDFLGDFDISARLDRFVSEGVITASERDAVDESVVRTFLDSEVCRDIREADGVFREYSFIIPFDSSKLFGGDSENIMVQGIIDCVYRKNGEYYIVDYKSDYYTSAAEIADRYRTQLAVYSEAVERKFGIKPRKSMLYMLRTGAVITA